MALNAGHFLGAASLVLWRPGASRQAIPQSVLYFRRRSNLLPCVHVDHTYGSMQSTNSVVPQRACAIGWHVGVVKQTRNRFILIVTATLMHFGRTD
jgi:hypothetical protein